MNTKNDNAEPMWCSLFSIVIECVRVRVLPVSFDCSLSLPITSTHYPHNQETHTDTNTRSTQQPTVRGEHSRANKQTENPYKNTNITPTPPEPQICFSVFALSGHLLAFAGEYYSQQEQRSSLPHSAVTYSESVHDKYPTNTQATNKTTKNCSKKNPHRKRNNATQ